MIEEYDDYRSFLVWGPEGMAMARERADANRITYRGRPPGDHNQSKRLYVRDSRDIAKMVCYRSDESMLIPDHMFTAWVRIRRGLKD